MYNGNNPTALKSQNMLLDALNDLLKEKNYKDISVSEICNRSGVSRQTFYTLFGTKENLILYQLEQSNPGRNHKTAQLAKVPLEESCNLYSEFIVSNYNQFKMLVENELMDVLNAYMVDSLSSCHQSFINVNEKEREYAALFMSAGLCQVTRKYIQEHKKPNQTELARLAFKIMSGDIYLKSNSSKH